MRKMDVFQLDLQFNFWVVEDTYNSLYFYTVSVDGQLVAWITKLQLIVCTM
jgi:hypothetical protein